MTAFPKQVINAGEAADAFIKELNEEGQDSDLKDPIVEVTTPELVVDPPEVTPDPVDKKDTMEYWRHRCNVIQGKYNKEIPSLNRENKELKASLANKDREIATLIDANERMRKAVPEVPEAKPLSVDDYNGYDPEIRALAEKVAHLEEENKSLKTSINEKSASEKEVKEKEALHKKLWAEFEERLSELFPGWKEMDDSPEFKKFLGSTNENGETWGNVLFGHLSKYDENGTYDIIKEFQKTLKGAETKEPAPEESQSRPKPRVSPDSSSSSKDSFTKEQPSAGSTKIWRRSDISKFYTDVASGKIKNPEASNIEKEIMLAQQEGRIEV